MKIKKLFAAVLGATLAMAMCVSPISAKAAETTYKGSDLVSIDLGMGDITFEKDGDAVNVTIPAQWNQACFEIPAEVMAAGLEAATFDLENADNVTLKFIGKRGETIIGIIASYNTPGKLVVESANIDPWGGDPAASADELGLIQYIDLMNGSTDPVTVKVNSVVFKTTNDIAAEAPAEEAPADDATVEAPATTEAPAELPKTGLVSSLAFLATGSLVTLAGAVVAKKKEN